MRRISTIATAALFVATAMNPVLAEDAGQRDLSMEQIKIYHAGTAKQSGLQVAAMLDHKNLTYAKGETVKLNVKVNEDAYVAIYNVGPTGKITQLFPNKFQKDGLLKAGHVTSVPPVDSKTAIKVTGDTGAELIKVVASNKPLKIVSGVVMSDDQVFMPLKEGVDEFSRDLSLATDAPAPAEKWSIVNVAIKTVPPK